ncbi:MAG: hypothetical protein QXO75_10080 [Nitrososphaerota archaeon]
MKKEGEDLNAVIKSDKYWKVSEGGKGFIFAGALDITRILTFEGRYVKVAGFGGSWPGIRPQSSAEKTGYSLWIPGGWRWFQY